MSDDNDTETEVSLDDHAYGDLMNLARSMNEQFDDVDIDTYAPQKGELIESLEEYDPQGSRSEGWTADIDGSQQDVDLLEVQTPDSRNESTGPTDSTVLYCLTRAETEQYIDELEELIEGSDFFELREAGNGSGDKYAIVVPAENQEGYEEAQEQEDEEETDSEPAESESEPDEDEDGAEEEETEETDSEADDEPESEEEEETEDEEDESEEESEEEEDEDDEEEIEDTPDEVPPDVYRRRLEDKTFDEVYDLAVEYDINGRSDMNKDELIDTLVEEHPNVADE